MNSREYWRKREEEALTKYQKSEAEYDKEIERIYADMLDGCQKEIDAFYGKYATAEGISIAEAKKRVKQLDIKEYERKAARYVRDAALDRKANGGKTNKKGYYFSPKAEEEMRLYNATMKINRLEMLKANIGLELIKGHDELDKFMGDILKGRTEEELRRQAGILGKTIRNNAQLAHTIPNASFHNATFSDRIWQYQDLMREDLSKILSRGLIQGKNPRAIAKDLQKYWYGNDPRTGGGAVYCMERLMRTEMARVQTEAQKQSFEKNGFTEYEFIANSNCCGICKALDGKHFKVSKMMPGENAAPIHPHCRCSVAAYEDSKEYEEWLSFLEKGGTTAEWEKIKSENPLYLRNNLPKAFKDTRTIGRAISDQELTEVIDFAKSKGVQIGLQGNATGGFETYCGDVKVLKEIIEELSQQQNSELYKKSGAKNAILCYDNVLGYNGDLSKVDIGAFAITKGRTITLNKFMFDDSDYLMKEYQSAANDGYFVKGSTYKNIVDHECGHIIEKKNKRLRDKILKAIEQEAEKSNASVDTYILNNISIYAAETNELNEYYELTAEINSLLTIYGNDVIIQSLRKEGVIK